MPAVDLTRARLLAADKLMPETEQCTITRDAGTSDDTFDIFTGITTSGTPQTIYTGRCGLRFQPVPSKAQDYDGAAPAVQQRPEVRIPFDSPEVRRGDMVTVTASQDATLIGRRLAVADATGGSLRASRLLLCERWVDGAVKDWGA